MFDSKAERTLAEHFELLEKAGELEILSYQDSVYLTDARILYKPDFQLKNCETGEVYWAEMKGFETPVWRIKRRLWKHYGPGRLEVYKPRKAGPFLHEEIQSKL